MSKLGMLPTTYCPSVLIIEYNLLTCSLVDAIDPLLDTEPVDMRKLFRGTVQQKVSALKSVATLARTGDFQLLFVLES